MYVRIERGVSTPISRQIAEQIRAQLLAGTLEPGQALPSVRQLAKDLVVNVNTVVRVYERLAAEGLVEMRHGEGTFVLPPADKRHVATGLDQQRQQFSRDFQAVIRRGLMLGIPPAELRRLLTSTVSSARVEISKKIPPEDSA